MPTIFVPKTCLSHPQDNRQPALTGASISLFNQPFFAPSSDEPPPRGTGFMMVRATSDDYNNLQVAPVETSQVLTFRTTSFTVPDLSPLDQASFLFQALAILIFTVAGRQHLLLANIASTILYANTRLR
jgi:hypothetical protein